MLKGMVLYKEIEKEGLELEYTQQLAPCPFCGAPAAMKYASGAYSIAGVKAYCTKCHIGTVTEIIGAVGLRPGEDKPRPISEPEAVELTARRWNRRAAGISQHI